MYRPRVDALTEAAADSTIFCRPIPGDEIGGNNLYAVTRPGAANFGDHPLPPPRFMAPMVAVRRKVPITIRAPETIDDTIRPMPADRSERRSTNVRFGVRASEFFISMNFQTIAA